MNELTRRPLGRSGLQITTVGFGSWAASGNHGAMRWGVQDDRDTIAAIHRAAERGVSWIDTAPAYGFGHAETVVGQALRELPAADRPLVFTKCGRRRVPDDPNRLQTDLRPDSIREEVDESSRRLGVEVIDLLQIHWPPPDGGRQAIEEAVGTLARLQDEGRIRYIGVSNFSVEQLEVAEAVRHVDSLQPRLSLIHPEAAESVIPWCAGNGTGVIVYSPMASGLLTDRMSAARLASLTDDWRLNSPDFQSPRLERNLALRDELAAIARRHGVESGAAAVAWALSQRGVTGAIVGARSPEQVDGWAPAATLALTAADLADIERARAGAAA
jgi:aryl-alcohol dehydrogenase-like predicted oxidoreductase